MATKLEHTFENPILTIRLSGKYAIKDILDELESCMSQYAPKDAIAVVFDATRSKTSRNLDEVRRSMHRFSQWKGKIVRFAVIVASDFHFGLTNQTSAYAEMDGIEIRPFRNTDEAESWLREKLG